MANRQAVAAAPAAAADPTIRNIGAKDLIDALKKGLADFNEKPSHVMFLCVIYPVVALLLARLTFGYEVLPLFFPLAAGFTLIGPLAAIGLYELSKRREQGLEIGWGDAFRVLRSPAIGAIALVGLVLAAIFVGWLSAAGTIYRATFGDMTPVSVGDFLTQVLTTPAGWTLIVVGNAVGFVFAAVALTVSVVSFPLLLDRPVDAATAIRTSVRAVLANPMTMALWGLIVAVGLFIGSVPLFVGLAVVLPVLGHATWHLYRKVVAW